MKTYLRGRFATEVTLVEIMLVVAIIAILAAVSIPNCLQTRKRTQALTILNGVRILENEITQSTIENPRPGTQPILGSALPSFLPCTKANSAFSTLLPNDFLGHPFTLTTVDGTPKVSALTFATLSDSAPVSFWSPYYF